MSKKFNDALYILIPVLREEDIIEETASYFLKITEDFKNVKIVFITTEKEYLDCDIKKNTVSIARELAGSHKKIMHFHYPGVNGVMAHQLNFFINEISKTKDIDNNFIAVYNVDSRPMKETFNYVFANKAKSSVFQQYGNYSSNVKTFPKNFFVRSILLSSVGWQNRRSLGIELFGAFRGLSFKKKPKAIFYPLNFCIGHGLFIKVKLLKSLRGFCEETHNEDSVLGFFLSGISELVHPIPFFDYSESPNSLKSSFYQKINWFFGPMQFYEYYSLSLRNNICVNKKRLFYLAIKKFNSAIAWVLGPMFISYIIFFPFLINNFYIFFYSIMAYVLFLVIPSYYAYLIINDLDYRGQEKEECLFLKILVGSFPFYVLYGMSAYAAIYKHLKFKLFKIKIEKGKTEINRA